MKIYIGPYKTDVIPIEHLERKYEKFRAPEGKDYLWEEDYKWYDWVVLYTTRGLYYLFKPLNMMFYKATKRNVYIHIDDYDVWSMDHTLSMIIVQLLKKLKAVGHGSSSVDNRDVPEHLRVTSQDYQRYTDKGELDDNWHKRWEYVIDEMIWSFEQNILDPMTPDCFVESYVERRRNGFRLFGKYYESLWS